MFLHCNHFLNFQQLCGDKLSAPCSISYKELSLYSFIECNSLHTVHAIYYWHFEGVSHCTNLFAFPNILVGVNQTNHNIRDWDTATQCDSRSVFNLFVVSFGFCSFAITVPFVINSPCHATCCPNEVAILMMKPLFLPSCVLESLISVAVSADLAYFSWFAWVCVKNKS